jgi:hypothetical protein
MEMSDAGVSTSITGRSPNACSAIKISVDRWTWGATAKAGVSGVAMAVGASGIASVAVDSGIAANSSSLDPVVLSAG